MSKLPNISTKGGDTGSSSLFSGERFPKSHQVFETSADLDLFDSDLGVIKNLLENRTSCNKSIITDIQKRLIYLKGELSTHPSKWEEYRKDQDAIRESDVLIIDQYNTSLRESLQAQDYEISGWILYGDCGRTVAEIDRCSKFCRNAEISVNKLYDYYDVIYNHKYEKNKNIISYINRLSDYLYWVARFQETI